jgi:hypothetical protein
MWHGKLPNVIGSRWRLAHEPFANPDPAGPKEGGRLHIDTDMERTAKT